MKKLKVVVEYEIDIDEHPDPSTDKHAQYTMLNEFRMVQRHSECGLVLKGAKYIKPKKKD